MTDTSKVALYVAMVAVALVVLLITVSATGALEEQYIENRQEKAERGNATYGVGNWTWETVGCYDYCVKAPRPINETVPNASVKVPPTEDDVCSHMFCGYSWRDGAILVGIAAVITLSVGLYGRYRNSDR